VNPFDCLPNGARVRATLSSGSTADVTAALTEAESALPAGPIPKAALDFARASLALREGKLDEAQRAFDSAVLIFEEAGDLEAAELSKIEGAVARARRGRREAALEAEILVSPLVGAGSSAEVQARAAVAKGTALRVLGEAARAQTAFAEAILLAGKHEDVRAQALNSLGTLCVVLGAFGAAETLCEHAAELCRAKKDVIGEAIAMGQLGAAAVGRGDLAAARKFLSRQEWLASRVGDVFGRTRALVWLAEVALESGRADDAEALANKALESASSVTPPLTTFAAYADRVLGRARLVMGDASGRAGIERAHAAFAGQKLPLGEALSARDLALSSQPIDREAALAALFQLGNLGLPERVSEAMAMLAAAPEVELALAAQSPRRLEPLEARLVYERPDALALVAESRAASRKNVSRLSVLALMQPGLAFALLALPDGVTASALAEDSTLHCAAVGGGPGMLAVAWPLSSPVEAAAADILRLRARAQGSLRGAFAVAPAARVRSAGFGGGLPPIVEGFRMTDLACTLASTAEGAFSVLGGDEAEPLREALRAAGLTLAGA